MPAQHRTVEVVATLRVVVSRDAGGDMVDGVRDLLGRVSCVSEVGEPSVRGVRPGMNDLRVELTAPLAVRLPADADADAATVADRLREGFGVRSASVELAGPE